MLLKQNATCLLCTKKMLIPKMAVQIQKDVEKYQRKKKNSKNKDGGLTMEDKDSKDNEMNLTDKNEDSKIRDGGSNFEDQDSEDHEKNLENKNEESKNKDESLKDEKEVIDTVNESAETAEDKLKDFEGYMGKKEVEELNADQKAVKVLEDAVEDLHEMMKLTSNKVTSSGNVLNRIHEKVEGRKGEEKTSETKETDGR
ncbi:hypothetical protein JTE90_007409 [Oedothorax gibbosus]|uniref:Uncharacterized protein n=1 Tax=Oedothorax gibbosus TaxID=931172 RepID=A0AAV6UL18_9ARAC|nr:hypothetical protein JTE90_007409 [Oedothorax gibbosus]